VLRPIAMGAAAEAQDEGARGRQPAAVEG